MANVSINATKSAIIRLIFMEKPVTVSFSFNSTRVCAPNSLGESETKVA